MSSEERLNAPEELVTYDMMMLSPTPACTSLTTPLSCGLLLVGGGALSGVEMMLPGALASCWSADSAAAGVADVPLSGAASGGGWFVEVSDVSVVTGAEWACCWSHPPRNGSAATRSKPQLFRIRWFICLYKT